MRGKIIHYNGNDGRGLIAADNRQLSFEIGHWRSDTAPAVNATVDLVLSGDVVEAVTRVPDEVLLKEKAGQLASKLGTAGSVAQQSIKEATPPNATALSVGGGKLLGKPLLVAHGAFVIGASLLTYLSFNPLGMYGKSFSLVGLSEASSVMGASVGGALWAWLGILSIALPVFWRNRFAWLALLLPLFATIKPVIDIAFAAAKATSAMGNSFEAKLQAQIIEQIIDALHVGIGAWVCGLAGLVIAGIGLKRVLLPPNG